MSEVLRCEGAPRDLGLDQGRGWGGCLREQWRELPARVRAGVRLGRRSDAARRLDRDLRRYFPHQAELLEGLSRGARVPRAWLVERLAAESARPAAGLPALAAGPPSCEGGLLARALPAGARLRRSAPEGGFRSIELCRPWCSAAGIGVNEAGLAVAAVALSAGPVGACAAPAFLWVQDCLQRFERTPSAVDWCHVRPGGGEVLLLLADRRGEAAAVVARGDRREVVRPADGLVLRSADAGADLELAKSLRQAAPLGAAALAQRLGGVGALALPGARRLGLLEGGEPRWFAV